LVSLEDALGEMEQVNLPGTIDQHPNWRRRPSVPLEELLQASTLPAVAAIMATSGRRTTSAKVSSTGVPIEPDCIHNS
jgi:4-alpha-glucanotransferase